MDSVFDEQILKNLREAIGLVDLAALLRELPQEIRCQHSALRSGWDARKLESVRFVVRVKLEDNGFASRLPAGATGTAAIHTHHVEVAHVIRGVMLRQIAILNYIIRSEAARECRTDL